MRAFVLVLFMLSAVPVLAADNASVSISVATPDASSQTITVIFQRPLPQGTVLTDVGKWSLLVSFKDGHSSFFQGQDQKHWTTRDTTTLGSASLKPAAGGADIVAVSSSPWAVVLTLPTGTLTANFTSAWVSFDGAQYLAKPQDAASGPCTNFFCAAPDKASADNYLSFSYSPAIHSQAQYTIDAQGRFVKNIGNSNFYVGATAKVATDNRPAADPDSFLVSGLLEWVYPHKAFQGRSTGLLVDWYFSGLEFDRQTTTKTFISSPVVEFPLRLYPAPNAHSRFGLGVFPYFGLETGTNLSNALMPGGSGFVFRGELGALVSFTVKTKKKYLSQISLTSNYTARVPATDEIFTNTHYISATNKTVNIYTMSTQTRNHLKDELDFTIAKPFSVTIKHEYGELPPGFRTIRNKISIGLTIQLQQGGSPGEKISPEG